MRKEPIIVVDCEIVEEREALQLHELARICGLPAEQVMEFVDLGIIEPLEPGSIRHWRFAATAVPRLQRAMRLQRDLGIERHALALVLDLLEEMERMRARLMRLQGTEEG